MSKPKYVEGERFCTVDEGLLVIRCRQAVWDYHCKRAQNAEFLLNWPLGVLCGAIGRGQFRRAIPMRIARPCTVCGGEGTVDEDHGEDYVIQSECPKCHGKGC